MPTLAIILSDANTISFGANAKLQAIKFGLSFLIGIGFGIFGLLYFRRSGKAERFITDLFATLALGGGYIACLEIIFSGQFELYGLISYLLGACFVPAVFKSVKNIAHKKRACTND